MRPYIQGLDEIEFSNLMRNWFKHDGLSSIAFNKIDKLSTEPIHKGNVPLIKSSIAAVITAIEDTIRNELYGYAKELEESKTKLESFLDGVEFALRPAEKEDV